ncbi:hypothetical protein GCN74_03475 [Janthinobacterium sp. FT14W]|uniref:hypothetical protein n=1 Tax=Janthinobacterium sp. FT14W TaxID=2654253 RepID=UPI0012640673|nr:hypothetical protein [Janthinobacterium sp. FT14W]KAB8062098.1 hypothetical protein GCN74_03475 [Janthinobacterium sp. FT14W]
MIKKQVINAVAAEFLKERTITSEQEVLLTDEDGNVEMVTIRFQRKRLQHISESFRVLAKANTISALPSGERCGCCGGSGSA